MTTITNPGGTPTAVYNRSGLTIANMTAGQPQSGSDDTPVWTDAVAITRFSGHDIVTIGIQGNTTGGSNFLAKLPTSTEIGDIVEVYPKRTGIIGSPGLLLFPPIGESINGLAAATGTGSTGGYGVGGDSSNIGVLFRKIATTAWRTVGGPV